MPRRWGGIYWADLGDTYGSRPTKRRPVLVVQAGSYNASLLRTVIAAVITSNTGLAAMPGNVFLPSSATGLRRDSVVNATGIVTLDKSDLVEPVGTVPGHLTEEVEQGLRTVLGL